MRVLFISGGDYKYGAPKSMISLILYLKEYYSVEPILLTKKHNLLNDICNENGIENHSFWYCDFMSGSPYTFFPLKAAKHIIKYVLYVVGCVSQHRVFKCGIDFETIDIIHTNHNRLQLGGYISEKKKIPHVWHIREFGKEDYNVVFYKYNTPLYMNNHADFFIAISDAVKRSWIEKGIREDKITTIYNGIENRVIIPKKKQKDKKFRLVITGHVQPSKGQIQIVEAIALLPPEICANVQLDIIGEGYKDYLNKIKKVIRKNGLNNIRFLGYCDNVPEKLSEYDVGVVCSRAEGFGRITVEYMRAGLYVIASDTGANPELISNSSLGRLYEYGNVKELAECVEEIYLKKEKYCVGQARNSAFSMEEYAGKVYEIYRKLYQNRCVRGKDNWGDRRESV